MTTVQDLRTRVLQRVVLPEDADPDVLRLYVEMDSATSVDSWDAQHTARKLVGRRSWRVPSGSRASFATYFNAFPASYWRKWTDVAAVRLEVTVTGSGSVAVYRSTASGTTERVALRGVEGTTTVEVELPLTPFVDGGWYWFDLTADSGGLRLDQAQWCRVDPDDQAPGTASIAITTFNRPAYLIELLRQLARSPEVLELVDEVLVVDQGTQKVREQPSFAEVEAAMGGRLRILEQANLGGSGGFARGMSEAVESGRSRYVLLLDDDVASEPESIARALSFADACRKPTIVGGHMFSMFARSTLHSFGEVVGRWRFWWSSAPHVEPNHDLGKRGLRETPWMHRRVDVDYNGWWMCLLPIAVVQRVGVSLPLFIKWDDAEYGLRAKAAGVPTVSLPGVGIWHVPWSEKDDALDWQAYFHQRNRLVVALLHSPYARGGRLVRESANHQLKHLLAMQYSVAELRLRAIEDVLSGPGHLHKHLGTVLSDVRALRAQHSDARISGDPDAYPPVRLDKPLRKGREVQAPAGPVGLLRSGIPLALKSVLPLSLPANDHPQVDVPSQDAQWWRLASYDSALVSSTDGTGAAWYQRDPDRFRSLLLRSARLHQQLAREWPRLSREYRLAAPEITSIERWQQTFEGRA